jgi:hypothetical protein
MRLYFNPKQIIAGLTALALAGCSLSATPPPSSQDPAPVYTAAAQTIIAQLTQAAQTATVGVPTPIIPTALETEVPATEDLQDTSTPASPSPTVTMTATATATAPPAATEPPPSSDPRLVLGNPSFIDSFDSGANWALYKDDHVSFEVDDGQLVMTAFNPDFWEGWMLSWPVISDFYLEMIATPQQCSGSDRYGMTARAQKSDGEYLGYFLGFTCAGSYSLRRWDGSNFVTIVDWTESAFIRRGAGQANRLGLMADGKKLALYANGVLLEEVSDDIHLSGKFGVSVGSVKTPDFTVLVDEMAYWELP